MVRITSSLFDGYYIISILDQLMQRMGILVSVVHVLYHVIWLLVVLVELSTIVKGFLDTLIVRWNIICRIIVMLSGKSSVGLIIRGRGQIPPLLLITSLFLHSLQFCHRIRGTVHGNFHNLKRGVPRTLFLGNGSDFCFATLRTLYQGFLYQIIVGPGLVRMAAILILFAAFFNTFWTPYSLHLFLSLNSHFKKTLCRGFLILLNLTCT